jgi:hypothetical protein
MPVDDVVKKVNEAGIGREVSGIEEIGTVDQLAQNGLGGRSRWKAIS